MRKFLHRLFTVSGFGYYFGQFLVYAFAVVLAHTIGTFFLCKIGLFVNAKFLWNLL